MAISEAELIEIRQRFDALESAHQRADKTLKSSKEYHDRQCRNYGDVDSMSARQNFERHSNKSIAIRDDRAALEQCAEACREDLERLLDLARA